MYERLAEVAGISRIETQSDNYDNKMHWSVIKVIVFIVTKEEQKIDLIEWENKLMGIWVEWWRNVLTFYVFYAASIVENLEGRKYFDSLGPKVIQIQVTTKLHSRKLISIDARLAPDHLDNIRTYNT